MTSKFISKLLLHLVANDPKIPVLNTGCTYKRARYTRKFAIEKRPHSYNVQPTRSCGKWREYTLPCSHALAVCKDNCTRPDAYMPDIYSRETNRKTYQSNFYPVGHEDFWKDAPCNLTFYSSNMNNQRGKKEGTRFRGEMNY
ncbi:hypothetical protein M9H77_21520 [Catharanthus roseus]|uniref:Uncharacterized protein n=1 Tax=Catharanthus roseus TaxID=4058 RepID=A0ACC0AP19_CATRO|nr:hypothetical protein M9H77_21520 [Catharanthus roseus]